MKRWNWPTTILYIKHKKANLKQGCSKLVGKKRKAPTGGWSGGLNCPIGTVKKKKCTGMSLSRVSRAAGPRHQPRARPGREGTAAPLQPPPARRRLHSLTSPHTAPRERGPLASRAGYSFKRLHPAERGYGPSQITCLLRTRRQRHFKTHFHPPRGCPRPPAPTPSRCSGLRSPPETRHCAVQRKARQRASSPLV